MNLFVTGGAGFIGSALCRLLIARGHHVINIDALTYAACPESLASIAHHPAYRFEHADICDFDRMKTILRDTRPDAIIHLAAESHVDRSIDDSTAAMHTNIMGTHSLLQAALGHWRGLQGTEKDRFRFLHISTDEVFGSLGAGGNI